MTYKKFVESFGWIVGITMGIGILFWLQNLYVNREASVTCYDLAAIYSHDPQMRSFVKEAVKDRLLTDKECDELMDEDSRLDKLKALEDAGLLSK